MYKEKLLELVDASDRLSRQMNYMLYWETPDGKRINNVFVARWYEREFKCWVKFVTTPELMTEFKEALKDKTIEKDRNYSLDFIKRLKSEYDHVALLYSGGYDSQRIFIDHVENGIRIDETIMHFYTDTDDVYNVDHRENAFPSLHKYKDMIDKQTFLYPHDNDSIAHYSDPWAFFKRPASGCIMDRMGFYAIENFYKGATSYDLGVPHNQKEKLEMDPKGCVIVGKDKPQLVYYKQRWYTTCIDQIIGDRGGLLNSIYFWNHPGNVKQLIKEARMYRDFVLDSKKSQHGKLDPTHDALGTLAFFKFYSQDEYNYVIGRPEIFNADKKVNKNVKILGQRATHAQQERWDVIIPYAKCWEKFYEIFPECKTKGLEEFSNQGKFAWFIDIDSLEIYTQQELIPNGFEDITTTKVQGMDIEDLKRETNHQGFINKTESEGDAHIQQIRRLQDQQLAETMIKEHQRWN